MDQIVIVNSHEIKAINEIHPILQRVLFKSHLDIQVS
jgi:hypothetical protein